MHLVIITLMPDLFKTFFTDGVVGRAFDKGLCQVSFFNPRDYTSDVHKTVDDRPYGGGAGMLMLAEPLCQAVEAAKAAVGQDARVVYLSPKGERFTQAKAQGLSEHKNLILICGRYEGIDQRVIDACVDAEISLGDYVLSGGELAAAVVTDAIVRLLPGVLGNSASAQDESFSDGKTLEYPQYTRPALWRERDVPEVLLSGDHKKIQQWRNSH
jgi:tRNA (guanine37-N1)-methyltransferase